jgi:serine/threonine protein phosphatase PrpC
LDVGALSDVGQVRTRNEDRLLILRTMTGSSSAEPLFLGMFVVADGMGGQADGDTASEVAVRTIAAHTLKDLPSLAASGSRPIQEVLTEAVLAAHKAILDYPTGLQGSPHAANSEGMGTTATVALLVGSTLYLAHVGDTRVYMLDDAGLHLLTRDHSLVGRLQELGQLTPAEAQQHPQRNVLYRALGQSDELTVETYYRRLAGVSHLLLCSDGLWGLVPDAEIVRILRTVPGAQAACEALIDAANDAGGEDNITAILLALPRSISIR